MSGCLSINVMVRALAAAPSSFSVTAIPSSRATTIRIATVSRSCCFSDVTARPKHTVARQTPGRCHSHADLATAQFSGGETVGAIERLFAELVGGQLAMTKYSSA